MEELKEIVGILVTLPQTALYVLIGYLIYKLCVVGSIYGIIRFGIDKMHSWLVTPKHSLRVEDIEGKLRSITIHNCTEDLIAQISRLRGIRTFRDGETSLRSYIHDLDVQFLRDAIDAQLQKETK